LLSSFALALSASTLFACAGDDSPIVDGGGDGDGSLIDADDDASLIDAEPNDGRLPIDAPPPVDGGDEVDARIIDAPPAAPGEACNSADPITPPSNPGSVTVTSTTVGFISNYAPTCAGASSGGPDRVHTITVPGNTRISITVDPDGSSFDPGIYIVSAPDSNCSALPIPCLASADSASSGDNDVAIWDNPSSMPRQVFVIVDSGVGTPGGAYSLIVAFSAGAPGLPGDVCQTAEVVTVPGGNGTVTVTGTTAGYLDNYRPTCAATNSAGPDRAHLVTVPAGRRLTATVDPTPANFDPAIYLLSGPASTCDTAPIQCLASADSGGSGANDVASYTNTGSSPRDVEILIDGFSLTGNAYSLIVTLAAP